MAGPLVLEDVNGQRPEMLLLDPRVDRLDFLDDRRNDPMVRNVEGHDKAKVRRNYRAEV